MSAHVKSGIALLTVLATVALLVQFEQPFGEEAGGVATGAFMACAFWVASCIGLGGALLKQASTVEAFAMGAGLYGLFLGMACLLFGVSPILLTSAGLLGIVALFRWPDLHFRWPPKALLVLFSVFLLAATVDVFAPPIDTDEIYQHLALPHQFLLEGEIGGGLTQPDAARPLPVHILFTALYSLGGAAGPKLFHLVLVAFLLCALWEIAERRVGKGAGLPATLLLLCSYSFLREMGLAYNNLPTALWCLLALDNALEDKPRRMALFSGMALAAKYTAAPVVAGIFLAWIFQKGLSAFPKVLAWTGLALCIVAPWWIRNLAQGQHALFPYAGWESESVRFMMLEKYGMGREVLDLFALPWNLSVHAQTDSFVFLGRVTPAGLLLLPAGLFLALKNNKALWIAAGVSFVGWALGPHWLRYLLPAAPILALALSSGFIMLSTWARWAIYAAFLLGLPANLGPWANDLSVKGPAAFGQQSREAFLQERVRGWSAVDWINQNSPEEAGVALLFAWPKAYVERPILLGSVEDHIPSRVHLDREGDQALQVLKKAGVSHVLVGGICDGCKNFLHKSYPFLSEAQFEDQFRRPEQQLHSLLLKEATKVFESGKYSVWRLL